MYDPTQLPLLAQNEEHGHTNTTPTGPNDVHSKHTEQKEESPFQVVLGELGDHREISFGPNTLFHLPVVLIDDGLHIYPSVEAMEHAGLYKEVEGAGGTHKIVRTKPETIKTATGKDTTVFKAPALDMSPTSLVFFQWFAMAILLAILVPMGRKYRKAGVRPLGGIYNVMEGMIEYVRDQVVLPNTGEKGMKLMPIFLTFFFFIIVMNYVGLVPGGHTATGSINVTAGLAAIAFFVIQIASISSVGIKAWLKHLTGGVHWAIWPIMIPVEIMGLFTKPFALCIRLYANMTAGHVILLSLIGLIFVYQVFIPVSIIFSLFIYLLELLVAFLQAYVFTMLTAVFVGMGMASHDHSHGDDHEHLDLPHAPNHLEENLDGVDHGPVRPLAAHV